MDGISYNISPVSVVFLSQVLFNMYAIVLFLPLSPKNMKDENRYVVLV